jgi:hypothetical protein
MCSVIMASGLVDYVFGLVSLISPIIQYETVCGKSNISLCEVGCTVEHVPKVFLLISETALCVCVCVCESEGVSRWVGGCEREIEREKESACACVCVCVCVRVRACVF